MQLKNVKVEALTSQEIKSVEGGAFPILVWGAGAIAGAVASGAITYGVKRGLNYIFPPRRY
ncbi:MULTISPECIES: class IIb bacteriocin, lactobin A/cerein 7B family [Chryseobacterium]|uniref:Class IIb bacteriocin, lactobin A/cerein 7B family n=2 Tax=Chryseobacterium TaxID=59732 RepID=A0A3M7TDS5_9FLAO|nr:MULTISPECIES: class IIb bacteriocin, lactobin A/cerein 7B family [Chryseobacterium]RNA61743.1 class IIb bacteriocin, lactobin A/cerein 7B family [Chryseobacterium nematophagum]CAA7393270.1 hypothetical protein CHRY9393_03487 [Chryseobacterium fistulae]